MDVQAISTALARTLEPLGIRSYDYGPAAPLSPAAWFAPESIDYHSTFDPGTADAVWTVRLIVGAGSDQGGQAQLNALISNKGNGTSVPDLLEADNTLGGVINSLEVSFRPTSFGRIALGDRGDQYFSAELAIEIYA